MPLNKNLSREELEQAVEEADALAQMKSNFLATMSHEIRTPMQTIYGILELINDEKPSPIIKEFVDTAQFAASGLLEILDDVLDLAKMDADKMHLDVFEVPIRTLIYGTIEALSVKVRGFDIELKADIDDDVPFVILGDPKRLRQIVMNLMNNALKFTEQGTVTIRVTCQTKNVSTRAGHVGLRFEVVDTGIGMSESVVKTLFQPFVQGDNSTQREFGGTGLGLSICKKLVDLMHGEIGVRSVEGEGSTFWFEVYAKEVGVDETYVDFPDLSGVSVIAVEDHPKGGQEIVKSLQSMGAQVELCTNCADALELVKRRPFDVAVIDQGLPDGLGLDLIKDIMRITPVMGMIMYTVRDDSGLQYTLRSLGVQYLGKPASRLGLGKTVQDCVRVKTKTGAKILEKVLVAEDNAGVRFILKKQFEKMDVEASFVENGAEAIQEWNTGVYGLLVTDLHMPEMDGYTLVKTLRDQESSADVQGRTPVILMTADVQMVQRGAYLRHGFDECLLKPVSFAQLRGVMVRWGVLGDQGTDSVCESDGDDMLIESRSAAFDISLVETYFGNFDQSVIDMLHLFIDITVPMISRIKSSYDNENYKILREDAHSLKGAAYSACCTALGDLAASLQKQAQVGNVDFQIIDQMEQEFLRACEEIKALQIKD